MDLWIYLRTPAELAKGRIQKRGRPEEVRVTLECLHALQCQYDKFFKVCRGEGSRVVQIDGSALLSALPEFSFWFE